MSFFCNLRRWLKIINLQLHDVILSDIVYNASALVPFIYKTAFVMRLSCFCA